jgi:hypothetical protein
VRVRGGKRRRGTPSHDGVQALGDEGLGEVAEVLLEQDGGEVGVAEGGEGDDVT